MSVSVSESRSVVSNSLLLRGLYIHGILQARILEWVAVPFSRGSFQPRDRTPISCIGKRDSLAAEPQEKPKNTGMGSLSLLSRSSQPRNRTGVSCIAGGFFTLWAIREPFLCMGRYKMLSHWNYFRDTDLNYLGPVFEVMLPDFSILVSLQGGDVGGCSVYWNVRQYSVHTPSPSPLYF